MSSNELLFKDKQSLFLKAPPYLTGLCLGGVALGVAAMAGGFFLGQGTRVWGAFLFNLFFFFSIALGAMALAAIQDVVGATWGRPIRRLQEGFGAFVPLGSLLFILFIGAIALDIGDAGKVYRWIANPSMLDHFWGKNVWLQPMFMYVRVVFILLAITGLVFWQLRHSLGRDKLWMDGKYEEAAAQGEKVKFLTRFWSAPIIIVFGVGFTWFCFDITMSLSPLWFSTLWGGWQFAVMMQTLMGSLLIVMFAIKDTAIGAYIKRQQFHDVGKLMHGFTVFFAYLTFAHVLTYWYGNVPEETEYFIHRLHGPWLYLVFAIPLLAFVIPLYSLIFKSAKWTAYITIPLATMILLGQWFTYLIIVMPEVVSAENFLAPIPFPFVEVGLFLGMFGLFLGTFIWFAKRYPMLPVADPLLAEALHGEHH